MPTFDDNFEREDSADLGPNWDQDGNAIVIEDGQARGFGVALHPLAGANQTARITLGTKLGAPFVPPEGDAPILVVIADHQHYEGLSESGVGGWYSQDAFPFLHRPNDEKTAFVNDFVDGFFAYAPSGSKIGLYYQNDLDSLLINFTDDADAIKTAYAARLVVTGSEGSSSAALENYGGGDPGNTLGVASTFIVPPDRGPCGVDGYRTTPLGIVLLTNGFGESDIYLNSLTWTENDSDPNFMPLGCTPYEYAPVKDATDALHALGVPIFVAPFAAFIKAESDGPTNSSNGMLDTHTPTVTETNDWTSDDNPTLVGFLTRGNRPYAEYGDVRGHPNPNPSFTFSSGWVQDIVDYIADGTGDATVANVVDTLVASIVTVPPEYSFGIENSGVLIRGVQTTEEGVTQAAEAFIVDPATLRYYEVRNPDDGLVQVGDDIILDPPLVPGDELEIRFSALSSGPVA